MEAFGNVFDAEEKRLLRKWQPTFVKPLEVYLASDEYNDIYPSSSWFDLTTKVYEAVFKTRLPFMAIPITVVPIDILAAFWITDKPSENILYTLKIRDKTEVWFIVAKKREFRLGYNYYKMRRLLQFRTSDGCMAGSIFKSLSEQEKRTERLALGWHFWKCLIAKGVYDIALLQLVQTENGAHGFGRWASDRGDQSTDSYESIMLHVDFAAGYPSGTNSIDDLTIIYNKNECESQGMGYCKSYRIYVVLLTDI